MKCQFCGGKMVYVGTSNGAETYKCTVCGNQACFVVAVLLGIAVGIALHYAG